MPRYNESGIIFRAGRIKVAGKSVVSGFSSLSSSLGRLVVAISSAPASAASVWDVYASFVC